MSKIIKSFWSPGKTYKLAELVKERPLLYDEIQSKQCQPHDKIKLWKQIAKELFLKGDDETINMVKTKWKIMKDSFTKSYKVYMIRKGKGIENVKEPVHFNIMQFMVPHINHRQIQKALTENSDEDDRPDQDEDDSKILGYIKEDPLEFEHEISETNEPSENHSFVAQSSTTRTYIPSSADETDEFFQSLTKTVKRLKPLNQALIKKTIANIILDIEIREAREASENIGKYERI